MTASPKTQIIQPIPAKLMHGTHYTLAGIISKFPNTHTPLIISDNKKKFLGLATVHNTLYNRKFTSSTPVLTTIISPPKIFRSSPSEEILSHMSNSRLYTLPVLDDDGNAIGIVKLKALLENLMTNNLFTEILLDNLSKKPVYVVSENSTVGEVFQLFLKKRVSRLIVVDSDKKMKGVVSKRSMMSVFFVPTTRQRFSTRGSPKNYSFDTESIKRNNEPLFPYISPITDALHEKTDMHSTVESLLKSSYNAVVLVNNNRMPLYILTTRNLLNTTLKVMAESPYLFTVVTKLPEEVNETEQKMINQILRQTSAWINKQTKIQQIRLSTKTVFSPERKPNNFEVNLKITTDSGIFFSQAKNRVLLQSIRIVLRQLKKQVRRSKQNKKS
ncbi:MAG: CBS domain-containing protein [Patescibacteria group bacterium]